MSLRCELLASESSSKVVPADTDGGWSGGRRIYSFTDCSWLSSSLSASITRYFKNLTTGAMKSEAFTIFLINTCRKVSDRSWPTVETLVERHFQDSTVNHFCVRALYKQKKELLMASVAAQNSVIETSQMVSSTRYLDVLLIFSPRAVSTADITFTWIRDLNVSPYILVRGETVLTDFSRIWFLPFSAYLSSWTISYSVDAQPFESAVPAAELAPQLVIVALQFIIVLNNALSARSDCWVPLFPRISSIEHELVDWGCWLKFFDFQHRNGEGGHAEKKGILCESTEQF